MKRIGTNIRHAIDYERVFTDFPVGLAVGRNRMIAACNGSYLLTRA